MFSKSNFVVPVEFNTVLKIRNTQNVVVHLIKEAECTVKHVDLTLYIKQNAESTVIALPFTTITEARDAHIILRNALETLRNNIMLISAGNVFNVLTFNPPLTTINVDSAIPLNILVAKIFALYVNGILIIPANYDLLLAPPRINWKASAPYILETDDEVTIHYV